MPDFILTESQMVHQSASLSPPFLNPCPPHPSTKLLVGKFLCHPADRQTNSTENKQILKSEEHWSKDGSTIISNYPKPPKGEGISPSPFLSVSHTRLCTNNKPDKMRWGENPRRIWWINSVSLCFRVGVFSYLADSTWFVLDLAALLRHTLSDLHVCWRGELWLSALQVCFVVEPKVNFILFESKEP